LTISTLAVLVVLLLFLGGNVLAASGRALAVGALALGALALVAFGLPAVLLPDAVAAFAGIGLFAALVIAGSNLGLRQAWGYLRTLD
jgi:hypothetical protein